MSKKKQGKEYKNNEKKDNYSIKRNKKPFSGKDLLNRIEEMLKNRELHNSEEFKALSSEVNFLVKWLKEEQKKKKQKTKNTSSISMLAFEVQSSAMLSAEKKIESIMKKESINELTINRKYLVEIFNADLLKISNNDGFPTLKPFVILYLLFRGILVEFFGNTIKFEKISDKFLVDSEQIDYLLSKINF